VAATAERFRNFIENDWGARLIRSWDESWMELPFTLGDRIGSATLGAASGQTVVGDSTTVLLYKLARACVDARLADDPRRDEIVADTDNFPTDRFVLEGIAAERGLTVRWITPDPDLGVTADQVRAVAGERTALVLLSHIAYRSGYIADVPAITAIAHDAGALVLWDLCHSAGSVPTFLDDWQVDVAVGCTYKYLNGGPGSPAFAYVRRELQPTLSQPIQGWMGAGDVFAMADRYAPGSGMRRFLSGTPPVVGMLALHDMLDLIEAAGIATIRQKSLALTAYAIAWADENLPGVRVAGPRDDDRRGGHITLAHPAMREVTRRLWERDVIPDFRFPDGLRVGLSPLSTSFAELERGLLAIREELTAAAG
jgi:kynureninase